MRILYAVHQFFPEYSGGTERLTLNLALAMKRAGHQIRIVSGASRPHPAFRPRGLVKIRRYSHQGIPVTVFKQRWDRWHHQPHLGEDDGIRPLAHDLLSGGRCDLLHVTHPMRTSPFIHLAAEMGIPCVLTLTDYFLICYRHTLLDRRGELCAGPQRGRRCWRLCRLREMAGPFFETRRSDALRILSRARRVVCPSQFLRRAIRREYPSIPVAVVPHGTLRRPAHSICAGPSAGGGLRFGYMGALAPLKGVHLLIQAFRRLRSPASRLVIHGGAGNSPGYPERLKALARGDRRIRFGGGYSSESEIARILQGMDLLCIPSAWHETYGMVIEEAFSAGIPVIASRIGAIPERVRDGINGLLVPAGDVGALVRAMERVQAEPALLRRLQERAGAFRPIEREVADYERIYREAQKGPEGVGTTWHLRASVGPTGAPTGRGSGQSRPARTVEGRRSLGGAADLPGAGRRPAEGVGTTWHLVLR